MALLLEVEKEGGALVEVRQGLPSLRERIQTVKLQVTNEIELRYAAETVSIATALQKKLEAERVAQKKPLLDAGKAIDARYKEPAEALQEIERVAKRAILDFQERERKRVEEERRKLEAERRRIEEEKRKEDEAAGISEDLGLPPSALQAQLPKDPPTSVKTTLGGIATRSRWTFKLDAIESVPRIYLTIDEKKVREAIRLGVRQIDGLTIFEEKEVLSR